MFDTMTLTKIVGGFCGAFLVFLLGGWVAEGIYHTGGGHGGEGEQAYVIEVTEPEEGGGGEESDVNVEEVLAAADAGKGENEFRQCKSCHSIAEGENGTGPTLYGVVGRPVDSIDGFSYSGALEKVAETWTPENLFHFLENPKGYAPGTKMSFRGIGDPEDRANLIAYLDSVDG